MNLRNIIQNIALVAVIGLLGYFSMSLYNENNANPIIPSLHPLFEIQDYDLARFNVNGQKEYTINGPYMEHFDDDRGSILNMPFVSYYIEGDLLDWTARSDIAYINQDLSETLMEKDVVLKKYDEAKKPTTILNSSQLFIHDKGESVTNDVWTKIRSYPNNTIEGVGLIGYPKVGKFDLQKDITSYYETNRNEKN